MTAVIIDLNPVLTLKKRIAYKKQCAKTLIENCREILTQDELFQMAFELQNMERALNKLKNNARS